MTQIQFENENILMAGVVVSDLQKTATNFVQELNASWECDWDYFDELLEKLDNVNAVIKIYGGEPVEFDEDVAQEIYYKSVPAE